jgi:hypothetical protein
MCNHLLNFFFQEYEGIKFSNTLVTTYHTTQPHIPEGVKIIELINIAIYCKHIKLQLPFFMFVVFKCSYTNI